MMDVVNIFLKEIIRQDHDLEIWEAKICWSLEKKMASLKDCFP